MKNHSLLSALVCVVGMGSVVASGLPPERIGFDLVGGKVSLGETGATMATTVYKAGWSGSIGAQCADYNAVADDVREVIYRTDNETCLTGAVSFVRADEGVALTTAFSAVRDVDTECAALALELPVVAFGGGAWRASNGKSGTFARDWDGKTIGFFNGRIDWLEFAAASGACFRVTIPGGTSVSAQDDRKWKVNNFTVRFFIAGGKRIAKGETRRLSCVITSPNGVAPAPDRKTTVKAGPDWILLDYKKDIVAGSALDFSNQGLQDAPAGKYGWLRNAGGHFEFEKRPGVKQRFYGVNLCFDACFPDEDLADRLVTRLVRLGYNTVRIHHFDTVNGLLRNTNLRRGLNPDQLARLDYLLARCFANGLYVTADLFTYRTVKWRDIGIDRAGDVPKQVYKNLIGVHEPAFEDWCEFSRQLLTHVNPHTGRAYCDEPGLPLISLINEGKLTWCWWEIRKEEPMRKAWTSWLAEKRAADPKFAEGRETDPLRIDAVDDALLVRFMADIERKLVVRQREFLRTLGVKALLTNQNCGPTPVPMATVSEDIYDYVDTHFYVDHPQFLDKSWRLPSRCGNQNPVGTSYCPYLTVAFTRSPLKPFCITEWNFSGPGMYRGAGGILTGALGALQDWDGLWRFSYSHSIETVRDDQGAPGYFDAASDPLGLASDRASVCLFLRGDLAALEDATVNRADRTDRLPESGKEPGVAPEWKSAAWQTRVGTTLRDASGWKTHPLAEGFKSSVPPIPLAPNPTVDFDKARGSFRIVTPKTCGGFAPSGRLSSGAIDFDVGEVAATVWASSLDGRPVTESKRMLVTHLTDVQADGNVYANEEKTVLLKWGRKRSIVRNGEARVSLALAEPEKCEVWALETTGRRLERIPVHVEGGRLVFTAAVKGPNGARMLYEVVRRSPGG